MAVPRSRTVTAGGLVRLAALAATTALVTGCGGGTRLAAAGLPGDGPTGTHQSSAGPTPPSASPAPSSSGSPGGSAGATDGLPDPRSAADLLSAARAAFAAAPSVHITGTAVRGADASVVDVRLKGTAGGTATVRTGGRTVRVTRIGDVAYVGGDLAFWTGVTGDADRARRLVGSTVRVPARNGNFGQYVAFTWPQTFAAVLPDPARPATTGPRTTIRGRPALTVRDDVGSTLAVAATGPAVPLRLDGLAAGQVVFLDLADYGAPVTLRAPRTAPAGGDQGS